MKHSNHRERGSTFIEFIFAGVPLLLLMISIAQTSLAMWSYVTVAHAVRDGARYAATKGQGCYFTNNSCATTVSAVAQLIATSAVGLDPGTLSVTLSASDGSSISCNPLNSCYSNSTAWPPTTADSEATSSTPASWIQVTGSYPATIVFLPTLGALNVSSGNLQVSSQQFIQF